MYSMVCVLLNQDKTKFLMRRTGFNAWGFLGGDFDAKDLRVEDLKGSLVIGLGGIWGKFVVDYLEMHCIEDRESQSCFMVYCGVLDEERVVGEEFQWLPLKDSIDLLSFGAEGDGLLWVWLRKALNFYEVDSSWLFEESFDNKFYSILGKMKVTVEW